MGPLTNAHTHLELTDLAQSQKIAQLIHRHFPPTAEGKEKWRLEKSLYFGDNKR
jgi:hypothetical protein